MGRCRRPDFVLTYDARTLRSGTGPAAGSNIDIAPTMRSGNRTWDQRNALFMPIC
jgi:hypothetical protein